MSFGDSSNPERYARTGSVATKLRHRETTLFCRKQTRQCDAMPSFWTARQTRKSRLKGSGASMELSGQNLSIATVCVVWAPLRLQKTARKIIPGGEYQLAISLVLQNGVKGATYLSPAPRRCRLFTFSDHWRGKGGYSSRTTPVQERSMAWLGPTMSPWYAVPGI